LIAVPYGKPLNFTLQSLRDATGNVERFRESERVAKAAVERGTTGGDPDFRRSLETLGDEVLGAMCEDLNTAVALAKALEGTRVILRKGDALTSEEGAAGLEFLDRVNRILGIVRSEYAEERETSGRATKVDVAWIEAKIAERASAKGRKDFELADRIRQELDAMGVELRDTPEGTIWRPKAVEI
jgi:cysteinyl-tRNA synthetase